MNETSQPLDEGIGASRDLARNGEFVPPDAGANDRVLGAPRRAAPKIKYP